MNYKNSKSIAKIAKAKNRKSTNNNIKNYKVVVISKVS